MPSNTSAFYCEHLTVCLYSFSLEYSAAQEKQFQNRLGKKKKNDSPDPGPERIKGKKAKESKNKDLRSSSELTALFVAAVRVSGEITTYFKRTRKNQEKCSRCVGVHGQERLWVIFASGSYDETRF